MKLERVQGLATVRSEIGRKLSVELTPKRWLRFRLYITMLGVDAVLLQASVMCGNLMHGAAPFASQGMNILAVLAPFYVLIALHRQAYSSGLVTSWRLSSLRAVSSLLMATMAVLFLSFYLQADAKISREVFSVAVAIGCVLLTISRFVCQRYTSRIFDGRITSEILVYDGVHVSADQGVFAVDAKALGLKPDINDPHMLDRLGRLLKKADRVVVACPPERRVAWAAALKGSNVCGELLAPELGALGTLGASDYGGKPTLVVSTGPLDTRNRAIKRLLDLSIAVPALMALAPLMLLTAFAIKLETPGSILFLQPRLGRGNRLFNVYKFRSMRADRCDTEGRQSTQRGDSRITKVGRIIRATSIDELPQILNVIKGDMSLVGPRPHALGSLAGDKLFWEVDQRYWHRHAAKPGITGLAQVRGFRGATHLQSDLINRLQADLAYLNGWTIWRDLQILIATVKVVFHKNAY